jgi:AcrR family transcriptional regulator
MARTRIPDAREKILQVAVRLFDAYGVHAVGMQQIIDEFGCGKNLLYREFATKDDLVVAYLARFLDDWQAIRERAASQCPDDPGAQLVAIIRIVGECAMAPGFRGCPVHNTQAEFPDPNHPAHQVAVEHNATIYANLLDLAKRAGAADPEALADRISLIVDGLNTNGASRGRAGAAPAAVAFAEDVVRAAVSR